MTRTRYYRVVYIYVVLMVVHHYSEDGVPIIRMCDRDAIILLVVRCIAIVRPK